MGTTVPGAAVGANIDSEKSSHASIDLGPLVTTRRPEAVAVAVLQRASGNGSHRWDLTHLDHGALGAIAAAPSDIASVAAKGRQVTGTDLAVPTEDRRSVVFCRSTPPFRAQACEPLPVPEHADWAARVVESCAAEASGLALPAAILGALRCVVREAADATTEHARQVAIARAAAICDAYDQHSADRVGIRQPHPGVVAELDGRRDSARRWAPQQGTGAPTGISSLLGLEGGRAGLDGGGGTPPGGVPATPGGAGTPAAAPDLPAATEGGEAP
jgi:hypothetical protein